MVDSSFRVDKKLRWISFGGRHNFGKVSLICMVFICVCSGVWNKVP